VIRLPASPRDEHLMRPALRRELPSVRQSGCCFAFAPRSLAAFEHASAHPNGACRGPEYDPHRPIPPARLFWYRNVVAPARVKRFCQRCVSRVWLVETGRRDRVGSRRERGGFERSVHLPRYEEATFYPMALTENHQRGRRPIQQCIRRSPFRQPKCTDAYCS
jgi:hypothetical protein